MERNTKINAAIAAAIVTVGIIVYAASSSDYHYLCRKENGNTHCHSIFAGCHTSSETNMGTPCPRP